MLKIQQEYDTTRNFEINTALKCEQLEDLKE